MITTKICYKCRTKKDRDMFTVQLHHKDGLASWCKDCTNSRNRAKHARNPELGRQKSRQWRAKPGVREVERARAMLYDKTPHRMFLKLRARAKHIGRSFDLTFDQFMFFWQKPCSYCGDAIQTVGLDRIDNSKGYIQYNVAACCGLCNHMKYNLSLHDFLVRCKKITELVKQES